MSKQIYLEPKVEVISMAPLHETLQTMSVNVMSVGAIDLSTPSEIDGTWEALF